MKTTIRILMIAGALFAGVLAPAQSVTDWSIPEVPAHAQMRTAGVRVAVVPERAGWTYRVGEPVRFNVAATADGQLLTGATVTYKVGPEMLPADENTAVLPESGLVIDGGTLKEPGFIRCVVTVKVGGRTYRGVGTAALSPEEIQPTQRDPEDFDAFWSAAKEELAAIPMEVRRTLIPEACTDRIDVYHVSIRTAGPANARTGAASRIYGILCVPKAPGKYPAILHVPGAGVRPYGGLRDLAARGAITLQIGIHGIPVNQPQEVYDQLSLGALSGYPLFNLDNRDAYYYRRVYLGCVRANDYLASLPEFDGENLLVTGGSQGGQLSIVTAALDPRVKALAAYYPAYCDVTGYLHGRAGGWPHMMNRNLDWATGHPTKKKIATTGYYDVVNFARRLQVPGHYAWGYNDEVCPPTSMYAAYNVISAPKQLLLALETGHTTIPEETAIMNDWMAARLGLE